MVFSDQSPTEPLIPRITQVIVIVGGKVFGLGDAPFSSEKENYVTFLVSKDFIRGQRTLVVKRLLLGEGFTYSCDIPELFDITGLTLLATKGDNTVFALSGAGLDNSIKVLYPPQITLSVQDGQHGTMAFLEASVAQWSGVKQLVIQREHYLLPIWGVVS